MKRVNTSGSPTGKRKKKQGGKIQAIAWHPAFVEAIQMELEDYKDSLEFHTEYPLNSEPLKIDCIVIKKAPDVVINKNIAAIFKEVNIIEYKSPYDYVSITDFYKVYGYACLYISIENISINNITISFIESRHPRNLLAHLKATLGYTVEKTSPGIYTVKGDKFPIQIIDSRQLSVEDNLWLKDLYNKLDPLEIQRILIEVSKHGKASRVSAYLDVITRANNASLREAFNMSSTQLSLEEILEEVGFAARWEAKGVAIGEARAKENEALAIARNMVDLGLPPETVISATMLDPEKVKALYQNK